MTNENYDQSGLIENYLLQQQNKDLLKFITCGSVDDGKSTLIGRLLYDTKVLFEDQLSLAKAESKRYGTVDDEEVDFALLVDGLQSEKQQGITIDVAYRFFSTRKRKFIIADTPGHEQYTRNTVTGASTADLAAILVDARKGVLPQTKRHSFLVSLLGIRNIVVAVNKMDLIDYSEEIFKKIVNDYNEMFKQMRFSLPYKSFNPVLMFIPISALRGDNVVKRSDRMPWYTGMSLLEYLENVKAENLDRKLKNQLRFPVQYINRHSQDFRGFSGTVISGSISVGDKIVVYPSMKSSTVKSIVPPTNPEKYKNVSLITSDTASALEATTILLNDEIDVSRGDLIVKKDAIQPMFGDSFEAMLVWMDEEPLANREYTLKIYTKEVNAIVSKILFKRDINSWEKVEVATLGLNDIARVKIDLSEKVAFDLYENNRATGAFILIDRLTHHTSAAGMIVGQATKTAKKRIYTSAEIALNKFIRKQFPEWGCKSIEEIESSDE